MRPWLRDLLWPLLFAAAYFSSVIYWLRRKFYPEGWIYRSPMPVISVGNIHVGGSGKSPLVMEIARHFSDRSPVIISRGYRAKLSARGGWVDRESAPALFGDEPVMMHRMTGTPVRIGRKRREGLVEAADRRHGLAILDDGFQHLAVARDLDIVCINARHKVSRSFSLPFGDLREPLSALACARAVVLYDDGTAQTEDWKNCLARVAPQAERFVVPPARGEFVRENAVVPFPSVSWGAFCGIASPERFFSSISGHGQPGFFRVFPDHHEYNEADFELLTQRASEVGAKLLVTTDKDLVKVEKPLRDKGFEVLAYRIRYDFPDGFWSLLSSAVSRR